MKKIKLLKKEYVVMNKEELSNLIIELYSGVGAYERMLADNMLYLIQESEPYYKDIEYVQQGLQRMRRKLDNILEEL